MREPHIYRVEFCEMLPNGFLMFEVDLGFNIKMKRAFRLHLKGNYLYDTAWDSMKMWFEMADEIYVKSIRPQPAQYYADITFRIEERWYNVLTLLRDNKLLWTGEQDASQQDELHSVVQE